MTYFSLVLDEATDISVNSNLEKVFNTLIGVAVKCLKLWNYQMEELTRFVKLSFIILSKTALNLETIAGGATDGAAVMVGSQTGVVTRIKDVVPLLYQFIVSLIVSHL